MVYLLIDFTLGGEICFEKVETSNTIFTLNICSFSVVNRKDRRGIMGKQGSQ